MVSLISNHTGISHKSRLVMASAGNGCGHATDITPIRVLIVDDHELLRDGLRAIFSRERDLVVCGEAENAAQALEQIRESLPDVVVVDIVLKASDGLQLVKTIHENFPTIRTIVLSMYTEELYGERAMRAGATGYVCKEQPAGAILHGIRQAFLGRPCFSERLIHRMLSQVQSRKKSDTRSPVEILSDRELEVFRCIGQGWPTLEIAKRLNVSRSAIDTYRERLKKKLGLNNGTDLTRQATLWVAQYG